MWRSRRLFGLRVATWYYQPQARDLSVLRPRMRELVTGRPRFGHERLHILLTREDRQVGRNKVHRLYKLEGPHVRMRARRRRRITLHRGPAPGATTVGAILGDGFRARRADKWQEVSSTDRHRQVALPVCSNTSGLTANRTEYRRRIERSDVRTGAAFCDNRRSRNRINVKSAR
jgi:hypothetical protein